MFGSKKGKTKELEQELEEKERQLLRYKETADRVKGFKEAGDESFTQITAGQAELDRGLTRVVDCIKTARQNTEDETALTEELKRQAEKIKEKADVSGKSVEIFLTGAEEEQEELTALVEQNKHFTTPAKNLTSETSGMKVELEELKGQVQALKEYFRSISVMSLHAAIEAGRMGDSGRNFMSVAEDIRRLSEEKEHDLQDITEQIGGFHERISSMEEQVGKLNSLLKDNNVSMSRIRKTQQKRIDEFKTSDYEPVLPEITELHKQLSELKECQKEVWQQENAAMDEMENIGSGFMDEQNAARDAETVFRDIMEQMKTLEKSDLEKAGL